MKLIIDIPDSAYDFLSQTNDAIANGTPLTESDDCVSRADLDRCLSELALNNAYGMPSFWCHDNEDYKVIPTKWDKGYQQALKDIEEKIAQCPTYMRKGDKE